MSSELVSGCVSCDAIGGLVEPPGGAVYQNDAWLVCLRAWPLLTPGEGFIILKRHCEELAELTPAELASLGPTMRAVAERWRRVLRPSKVHFGLYGESVKHVHLHVLPRMPYLPAGNIPITLLGVWYRVLYRLRLRGAYSNAEVAALAYQLRAAL